MYIVNMFKAMRLKTETKTSNKSSTLLQSNPETKSDNCFAHISDDDIHKSLSNDRLQNSFAINYSACVCV